MKNVLTFCFLKGYDIRIREIEDKNKIKYKKLEVNVLKIITLNNISKKP